MPPALRIDPRASESDPTLLVIRIASLPSLNADSLVTWVSRPLAAPIPPTALRLRLPATTLFATPPAVSLPSTIVPLETSVTLPPAPVTISAFRVIVPLPTDKPARTSFRIRTSIATPLAGARVTSSESLPKSATRIPLKSVTSTVLAPAESPSVSVRVRSTTSIPVIASRPIPVRLVSVTTKSTSPDSRRVSVPAPPLTALLPAEPTNTLSRALPISVSSFAVPMTFSIPSLLPSRTSKPADTVWSDAAERSTATPTLSETARREKSSVSVSASAASSIVTLPETDPTNS